MPRAQNIEIVEFAEPERYAYVGHAGKYSEIKDAFERLYSYPNAKNRQLLSVWLDDPEVIPVDELRSHACFFLEPNESVVEGFQVGEIPAGRYARLEFKGPYSELIRAWKFLFELWLPHSGERARCDAPGFEVYLKRPSKVPGDQLLTALYIALK